MQATPVWACAIAPKRLRFAHAQNDLIWTAADATEFDLAAAPNGGYRSTGSAFANTERQSLTCATRRIWTGGPARRRARPSLARYRSTGLPGAEFGTP